VNWRSGGVESERGGTVKAGVGFIVAGTDVGTGLARRGVHGAERRGVLWCCQGASNTWSLHYAHDLTLAEQPNVRISP
jgi:hypothetical protein